MRWLAARFPGRDYLIEGPGRGKTTRARPKTGLAKGNAFVLPLQALGRCVEDISPPYVDHHKALRGEPEQLQHDVGI